MRYKIAANLTHSCRSLRCFPALFRPTFRAGNQKTPRRFGLTESTTSSTALPNEGLTAQLQSRLRKNRGIGFPLCFGGFSDRSRRGNRISVSIRSPILRFRSIQSRLRRRGSLTSSAAAGKRKSRRSQSTNPRSEPAIIAGGGCLRRETPIN